MGAPAFLRVNIPMRFHEFVKYAEDDVLLEQRGGLKFISKQQAVNRQLFGPVYHGTSQENWELIKQEGFKTIVGLASSGEVRNGYDLRNTPTSGYAFGLPPPVHHLGYGIYFTTSKLIAKTFNEGSLRGLIEFYLNVPRLGTINFGAPNTMMKWWMSYGYDMPKDWVRMRRQTVEELRVKATMTMTKQIRKEYDAVWYKGRGVHRLLDGDQICVYDPRRIYAIDPKLAKSLEVGSRVTHNQRILPTHYNIRGEVHTYIPPPNIRGTILDKRPIPPEYWNAWEERVAKQGFSLPPLPKDIGKAKNWYTIQWSKGGTNYNYTDLELVPVSQGGKINAR